MTKLNEEYVKLADLLDKRGKNKAADLIDRFVAAAAAASHSCNCENEACEKLGEHSVAGCKKPAGQFKAMYIGGICDDCAENLPKEYLIGFKNYEMPPDKISSVIKKADSHIKIDAHELKGWIDNLSKLNRLLNSKLDPNSEWSKEVLFLANMVWGEIATYKHKIDAIMKPSSLEFEMKKEAGSVNDYLDAALRDLQELARQLPQQKSYELEKALKELEYHLGMVKNEMMGKVS